MVVYGQVLVACKFWWHWTFYGQVWWSFSQLVCGQDWWSFNPATDTRTTPRRAKFGGHVNVKFGGHVNVKLGHSGCAVEAEVAVCVVLS